MSEVLAILVVLISGVLGLMVVALDELRMKRECAAALEEEHARLAALEEKR